MFDPVRTLANIFEISTRSNRGNSDESASRLAARCPGEICKQHSPEDAQPPLRHFSPPQFFTSNGSAADAGHTELMDRFTWSTRAHSFIPSLRKYLIHGSSLPARSHDRQYQYAMVSDGCPTRPTAKDERHKFGKTDSNQETHERTFHHTVNAPQ